MIVRLLRIMLLSVAAALVALAMLGLSRKTILTPLEREGARAHSKGYSSDGWLNPRAEFQWSGLTSWGNRVRIEFNSWRPAGAGPAALSIYNCGTKIAELLVTSNAALVVTPTATCPHLALELVTANPFTSSDSPPRILGLRLERIEVLSAIGFPIVDGFQIALTACLLLLTWVSMWWGLGKWGLWSIVGFTIFLLLLAWHQRYFDSSNVLTLALLVVGICLGARLALVDLRDSAQGATVLAGLAVIVGIGLRFYGMDFGLPAVYHPDELQKVGPIERMAASGNLNPGYFLHPSLLLYLSYAIWTFVTAPLFSDAAPYHQIILAGRAVSVLAGSFSVLLVYLIGTRLVGAWRGSFAAFLLAVFPLAITTSRYMKEDALLTALVLGVVLLVLVAVEGGKKRVLLLAGLLVGVAAAAKYTGILSIAIVLAAPWLRAKDTARWLDRSFGKAAIGAVLLVPVGFLVCSPYVLLDLTSFLRDFGFEARHMTRGHTSGIDAWSQLWMFHWRRSVIPGTSFLVAFMATIGIGIALQRRDRRLLFLVGLLLLFYIPAEFVKAKPAPQFDRYVVPTLPFLAMLASLAVSSLTPSRIMTVMGGVIVALFPMQRSVELARDIMPDTRNQAAEWVDAHLPAGTSVLQFWEPYSPPLDSMRYQVIYESRPDLLQGLSVSRVRARGAQYLVLSSLYWDRYFSQPGSSGAQREVFRKLFAEFPERARFTTPSGTYGFHNPEIRILEVTPQAALPAPVQSNLGSQRAS